MTSVINLTPGAISLISTGKCTENDDLKPVLQVIYINSSRTHTTENKQWCLVGLSDGSFKEVGFIPEEIFISNKLQMGDILQLTKFQFGKFQSTKRLTNKGEIVTKSCIRVCGLNLLCSKCDIIGAPKQYCLNETPLVERTAPKDHANSHHVEEPPTSIQNHKTMAAVNLTSGAISKISTGKCTENDLKPVLQVITVITSRVHTMHNKKWYWVGLSDGSFFQIGGIAEEIFISNKLQKGSIVQLTKFQLSKFRLANPLTTSKGEILSKSGILCFDLTVIHTKCGIIGDPNLILDDDSPLVERTTPTLPDEDRANSHHVEESPTSKQKQVHVIDIDDVEEPPTFIPNPSTSTQKCSSPLPASKQKQDRVDPYLLQNIDDGRHVEEPPTSKPNPLTSTKKCSSHVDPDVNDETHHADEPAAPKQKCSSCSQTQSRKRQRQSSDNKEDSEIGACFEKLKKLGWGKGPMYDTAVLLFGESSDFRKIWMDYCVE